ncbi:cytochrome P450 [Xylariaceae sp. FL0255]|nr:cytochrome P450 [Xylariaceae sp. FL0255]
MAYKETTLITDDLVFESNYGLQLIIALTLLVLSCIVVHTTIRSGRLTVVNRFAWFEPSLFARLRWSLRAQSILDAADKKACGKPYLLARGDKDIIVLPATSIPKLNRMGPDILDARKSHAFSFVAHLTGLEMTATASYQKQILQRRVTPALPTFFSSVATRISMTIESEFPAKDGWTEMKLLPAMVDCVSQGMSLVLFGSEASNSPRLIKLAVELTEELFGVALTMRLVPSILQSINSDATTAFEKDPSIITTLAGSVATGSIFSVANLTCHMIADLAAHTGVLEEVRQEIRTKHEAIGGHWDLAALSSLDKLDSAMKETSRLASSPIIVYSRIAQQDCVVGGLAIKKRQSITKSASQRTMDPELYENPGDKLKDHRTHAFRTVDTNILTWGAGRAACPGRLIADAASKVLLLKLLDEYDFALIGGKSLERGAFHEFVFFHPDNNILIKRRQDSVGIKF